MKLIACKILIAQKISATSVPYSPGCLAYVLLSLVLQLLTGAQVTPQLPESTSASLLLQLTCYYAMQSDNAELFVKAVLELAHNDQVQLQSMLQGLMTEYEVSDAPQINLPVKSVPASTEKGRALGPQLGSSARIAHHELESLLAGEAEAVAAAQYDIVVLLSECFSLYLLGMLSVPLRTANRSWPPASSRPVAFRPLSRKSRRSRTSWTRSEEYSVNLTDPLQKTSNCERGSRP